MQYYKQWGRLNGLPLSFMEVNIMAEYTAVALQTVAAGEDVAFTETP